MTDIACHNVTYQPTQENTPHLNQPQPIRLIIDLPTPEGWKVELNSVIFIAPRPEVKPMTAWSKVRRPNHCGSMTLHYYTWYNVDRTERQSARMSKITNDSLTDLAQNAL